ncbi:SDR family oxidoreductase [Halomonas maura]|uniref:SDR family oxidoreductase n=1 Tax=Halomonas maura TaxID=117606 RepID=UPI0025B44F7E|nr:SDR family oxidoreductase [Halomonas maura]MDN3558158.1 SDR family oxidoreductase [Halomonas maura]
MENRENIVFGAGPLGLWVARVLAGQGRQVAVVNRSGKLTHDVPGQIQVIAGNADDPAEVYEICKGADSVFHCAMPPYTQWPDKFPSLTGGILGGVKQAGCKLIYGDNLYGYGDTKGLPLTEELPCKATGRKGKVRASMAELLLSEADVRVVIGRGSDFYGPLVTHSALGESFFKAALSGKPANLLGNVDLPHTYTYIKDFAGALVKLSDHEDALGQVWHVPNAPTMTTRQLVSMVEQHIGRPIKIRAVGKSMVALLGVFNPMLREVKEMMYEWEQPYIVEHKRYAERFGDDSTPHDMAIKETIEWYREHVMV